MFTDEDWDGILKLSDSVKEKDPMKVGRFGLGFKSVYHVTGMCISHTQRLYQSFPRKIHAENLVHLIISTIIRTTYF